MLETPGRPLLTRRFDAAFLFASDLHRSQVRHNTLAPYISHLMGTAAGTLRAGGNEDQAIGALLHDAVEDQDADPNDIANKFGSEVARIVADCTDASRSDRAHISWSERKTSHLARLRKVGNDSLLVVAADKCDSLGAIVSDIDQWGFRQIFAADLSLPHRLLENYEATTSMLRDRIPNVILVAELERLQRDFRMRIARASDPDSQAGRG